MKIYTLRVIVFLIPIILILTLCLLFIPNKKVAKVQLAALPLKHALLKKATAPKIVFIGGSNLSFGLNSEEVSKAFNMPVINMGLHAGLGLRYMLNMAEPFINKGDIVVISPEYSHFQKNATYNGLTELVAVIFDVYPESRKYIDLQQWFIILPELTQYSISKIKNRLSDRKVTVIVQDAYHKNSFNSYGDAYKHWGMAPKDFTGFGKSKGRAKINESAINQLKEFCQEAKAKQANVIILPPVFQATSFENTASIISDIELSLKENNIAFDAQPEKYKFHDSLFFDTPYHLLKSGVDIRTNLIINDIKKINISK